MSAKGKPKFRVGEVAGIGKQYLGTGCFYKIRARRKGKDNWEYLLREGYHWCVEFAMRKQTARAAAQ